MASSIEANAVRWKTMHGGLPEYEWYSALISLTTLRQKRADFSTLKKVINCDTTKNPIQVRFCLWRKHYHIIHTPCSLRISALLFYIKVRTKTIHFSKLTESSHYEII